MVEYKMSDAQLSELEMEGRRQELRQELRRENRRLNPKLTKADITSVEWIPNKSRDYNSWGGHFLYTIEFYIDGPLERAGQTGKVYFKRKMYKTKKRYRDFTKMKSSLLSISMPRRDQWKKNILNSVPFPPKKLFSSKMDEERKDGLDDWLNIWIKLSNAIKFNDHFIQKLNEFFGVDNMGRFQSAETDNGDDNGDANGGANGDSISGGNRCRKNTKRRKFSKSRKSKRRLKTKRRRR